MRLFANPRKMPLSQLVLLAAAIALAGSAGQAAAQEGPPGITRPVVLPPFDRRALACTAPTGLTKLLAFAQDNERKFMQGVAQGLSLAAKDRGLEYQVSHANNDPAMMIGQVQHFLSAKSRRACRSSDRCALADPLAATSDLVRRLCRHGGAAAGDFAPKRAAQYLTGKALGDKAAEYIKLKLGGKAKVVLLTHDSLQFSCAAIYGDARFAARHAGSRHCRRYLAIDS